MHNSLLKNDEVIVDAMPGMAVVPHIQIRMRDSLIGLMTVSPMGSDLGSLSLKEEFLLNLKRIRRPGQTKGMRALKQITFQYVNGVAKRI